MMGRAVRLLMQALGLALCLSGGLWTLQGLGIVDWPAGSFMLQDSTWAYRGMLTFGIGAILLWFGFRGNR